MHELRHQVTPLELLRHTMAPRFERHQPMAPDSQFEFLPRKKIGTEDPAARRTPFAD
jgi:hypothetical protein